MRTAIFLLVFLLAPLLAFAQAPGYVPSGSDATARASATAAQTDADDVVRAEVSLGAEAADKINISVITVDRNGNAVARVTEYMVEVFTADGLIGVDTDVTLEEIGVGAHISGDVEPRVFVTTDATGAMAIQVNDLTALSSATWYVVFTPIWSSASTGTIAGVPVRVAVTFDGA